MIGIYTLSDPRTNTVFYVGASKDTVKNIVSRHLCNASYFGIRKELRKAGLKPLVEFIEHTDSAIDAGKLESYWIWQFKTWGFQIENKRMCSGYIGSSNAFMSLNWRNENKGNKQFENYFPKQLLKIL